MASIRRTLSPVPRPGALMNGESCQVSSPLSKSSSNIQYNVPNSTLLSSSMGSLEYVQYKIQNFTLGLFSRRSPRTIDRSRVKGQLLQRSFLHFLMCFAIGIFVGLTPFFSPNSFASKHQSFDFELVQSVARDQFGYENQTLLPRFSLNENSTSDANKVNFDGGNDILNNSFDKLLIIVTPVIVRPFQIYYLTRLSHVLKLAHHPLLWIVVEMNSQLVQTAELLRNTGVTYRHLVCSIKNSTDIAKRSVYLRNVALSHIEKHHLDGIVYFADDDKIYSYDLFNQMRQISRFGTWTVAKLVKSKSEISFQGPICNGSQVIGWHMVDKETKDRRFHADMSGFAFNSTIIWDQKRWHRPTLEPIRHIETVKESFQASSLIGQIVEDESQMECFSMNSSGIMVWRDITDSVSYPRQDWLTSNNAGAIVPLV